MTSATTTSDGKKRKKTNGAPPPPPPPPPSAAAARRRHRSCHSHQGNSGSRDGSSKQGKRTSAGENIATQNDDSCVPTHSSSSSSSVGLVAGLPLYNFNELPRWMQTNPYIHTSYRAHYTTSMCLQSLFSIHNETGNIWTHFLGFIGFIYLFWWAFSAVLQFNILHYFVFVVFCGGCLTCLGCSTAYHLLAGHKCEKFVASMLTMDYFGITCLVIGSFYPPCYIAFTCHWYYQLGYIVMISLLGGVGLIGPFFDFWHAQKFRGKRILIYVGMVGSGLLPSLHFFLEYPKNGSTLPILGGVALMFLLYFLGLVVYMTKVPESLFPGKFDLLLSSHQLWHIFVLAAGLVHFFTCIGLYNRYDLLPLHC